MAWPVPSQYKITTAYGKRGPYWSCNENSSGGVHTGADFACPSGTPLYATIAGDIRHRNYGSAFGSKQFAISPDADEPFGDGEVFYAHCRDRLPDGTRVEVGDWVGEAGDEGNTSGPHLHYEYHPHSKNAWNCSVHADPAPTLGGSSSGGSGAPYVTDDVYRSKCGYGEPSNGDASSDTVKELQHRLNNVSLEGGQELPITGKYDVETDEEVRLWQEQICGDTPDPAKKSYLGPKQFAKMFPDSIYTLHDDGDPAIASGGGSTPPPETSSGTTLGQWLKAQGFVVHDDDVPLGRDSTWKQVDFLMVHHTVSDCDADPQGIVDYCRYGDEDVNETDIFPPLCQIVLDHNGEIWMTCRERDGQHSPGRASHAGSGSGYGLEPDTMNQVCLGIECQCSGSHALATHATLYSKLIELLSALSEHYQVSISHIIGHKEWSSTGKTDPLDDMDVIRADVSAWTDIPIPPEPEEPPVTEPPSEITFPLGIQYWYSGKPSGEFVFSGTKKFLDVPTWAPKKDGLTLGMLYANIDIDGEFRSFLERMDPSDQTAYQTHHGDEGGDNYTLTHVWFESGEANRKLRYGLYSMDGQTGTVTTRYVKFVTIPWDVVVAVAEVGVAYMTVVRPVLRSLAKALGLPWPDLEAKIKEFVERTGE